jgi:hypothetical protein
MKFFSYALTYQFGICGNWLRKRICHGQSQKLAASAGG